MDPKEIKQDLGDLNQELVRDILADPRLQHLDRVLLPNDEKIVAAIELLRALIYPGYVGRRDLTSNNLAAHVQEITSSLSDLLYEQVRCCLRYQQHITASAAAADCDREAGRIVTTFMQRIPVVRKLLSADVQAAFDSDPAATSTDETIFCYPGLLAITVQRLAHEFYNLQVPLLPRIMTEYAHTQTGIDIHPGAQLGQSFFIDHGTGVVIGETTIIGNRVKVYQGVTLGAVAPAYGQLLRGQKRHPTIEDDVTIYSNATILGGETVIGKGAVVGGNVFLTTSVPASTHVNAEPPQLRYRQRKGKRITETEGTDGAAI